MLYWLRENCYHLHITAIKPSENHVNRGSLVEKVVVFHCNLPIVGDFNCYVDNTGDSDFIKFNRIAELINLKQHDNCSTNINGHTLVINLRPPPPPPPRPPDGLLQCFSTTGVLLRPSNIIQNALKS